MNMSDIKTKVRQEDVLSFLRQKFSGDVAGLVPLKGGELSQAFRFRSEADTYIARVNWRVSGFEKDRFAFQSFPAEKLLIPRTLLLGEMPSGLFISITEDKPGKHLDQLSSEDLTALMPQLIAVLDAIHETDLTAQQGYGFWNKDGRGAQSSWRTHLLSEKKRYRYDYEQTFKKDHEIWPFFETAEARIEELMPSCPEIRQLVHGDFGYDNTLVAEGRVTGVIDWQRSLYGDPLMDVAWLQLFSGGFDYLGAYKTYSSNPDVGPERQATAHFSDRIACYSLLWGLDGVRFYAAQKNETAYHWAKGKLLAFLPPPPD